MQTQNGLNEEEEKDRYTIRKCGLKGIIREEYREIIVNAITEKSIKATKICALASLLLLEQVQRAYDAGHQAFFNQCGQLVIKSCFHAVLQQNAHTNQMPAEFRELAENLEDQYRFEWPENRHFGNGLKDLIKQYATNVKTNLKTHCKDRLVAYLKLIIFKHNTQSNPLFKYVPNDISNVVNLLIYKKDIEVRNNDDAVKIYRRDCLIERIQRLSWWDIHEHGIFECRESNWFKSMPMWIAMQREIDEWNISYQERYPPDQHFQFQPPQCNRKRKRPWWCRKKQMLDDINDPPEIRNLSVIPICNFRRTHYIMDNYTVYTLLSECNLLPKKGKNANIEFKHFMRHKYDIWNMVFKIKKIQWMVRNKCPFDFRILSDGVSVSMQFQAKKPQDTAINLDRIRNKYLGNGYGKVLGIDPGLNKWNSTVQRDVQSGKEVRIVLLLINYLLCI